VACGGSAASGGDETLPDDTAGETKPEGPAPQDKVVALGETAVTGERILPTALGNPALPPVTKKKMPKLGKAKTLATKKKAKPQDVHIYATLLAQQADNGPVVLFNKRMQQANAAAAAGNAQVAQAKRAEAEGAQQAFENIYKDVAALLTKLVETRGDKAEELDVHRMTVALLWAGDTEGAIAGYQRLIKDFASSEQLAEHQAWLAKLYIDGGRVSDAAAITGAWDARAKDTPHYASYMVAWTKLAERDYAAAIDSVLAAAVKWPNEKTDAGARQTLLNEATYMIARGNGSLEQLQTAVANIKGQADKVALLTALNQAALPAASPYNLNSNGRFGLAVEVLGFLTDAVESPAEKATFQYYQGLYATRINAPTQATGFWSSALTNLESCTPETCKNQQAVDGVKVAIAGQAEGLAPVYYSVYAATLDDDYATASKTLYDMAIKLGSSKASQFQTEKANLEETIKRADATKGMHSEDVIGAFLGQYTASMSSCYEGVLLAEPGVSGSLKITLDVQDDGRVSGGATEPAAGQEGLAAVAQCVIDTAKGSYDFGGRSVPGLTRVSFTATFTAN